MALVTPSGVIEFIEAGRLNPMSTDLVWFPDGRIYSSVVTAIVGERIRISGARSLPRPTWHRPAARAQFYVDLTEVVPIVHTYQEARHV